MHSNDHIKENSAMIEGGEHPLTLEESPYKSTGRSTSWVNVGGYTVKNGSLLSHNNVSLLGHVSKTVSILAVR